MLIKSLSKSSNSCNETVDVNAFFMRVCSLPVTLTSPVVSMGNSKDSGTAEKIVVQNYHGQQRNYLLT